LSVCKLCGRRAAVYLPYANLRLCRSHFEEYFVRRIRRTIEKYKMVRRGEKVLVAVSGGKDSVVLLSVLSRIAGDLGISLHGLTIDLGIHGYSDMYVSVAREAYELAGVEYTILRLEDEYGFSIDEVAAQRRRVCAHCGLVKRYVFNRFAWEKGFDAIATGHNLDDLAAAALSSIMRGDPESAYRIKPVLPGGVKLVRRIRPLAFTREKDIKLYACLKSLPIVRGRCPHSRGETLSSFKRAINMLEDMHPSLKYSFARTLYERLPGVVAGDYRLCARCGMPSSGDICGFCRLRERVLGGKGVER